MFELFFFRSEVKSTKDTLYSLILRDGTLHLMSQSDTVQDLDIITT
jgi:hypothetical protein